MDDRWTVVTRTPAGLQMQLRLMTESEARACYADAEPWGGQKVRLVRVLTEAEYETVEEKS
jgi:hypothetical protein